VEFRFSEEKIHSRVRACCCASLCAVPLLSCLVCWSVKLPKNAFLLFFCVLCVYYYRFKNIKTTKTHAHT
jgi:hypothetical protein